MSRRIVGLSLIVLFAAAATPAHAQPAMTWNPAYSGNYSSRLGATIDMIVIHKAEGSLDGTVSWFRNPSSKVSAHYVVSETEIVHMVDDSMNAWHAGNSAYNHRSIGIENEGYNYRDDFTDAHYRRLASLVAWLCQRHGIPIDRHHIIGHNEVPDPNHPGQFGGSGHHACPGPYFKWDLFMSYVQQAAGGSSFTPPAPTPTPRPSPVSPAPASGGARAVSVTATSLNVRSSAGGSVIGQAVQSSGWVLTGNADQGFVEIFFRGQRAWVYSSYTSGYSGTGARVTASRLNVRDGSSTSSNVVGSTYAGQAYVKAQDSADGAWTLVRFDENRRWVYKAYTSEVALAP